MKDKYKIFNNTTLDYSFPISWAKKNKDYLRPKDVWTHRRIVDRKNLKNVSDDSTTTTSYEEIYNELKDKL